MFNGNRPPRRLFWWSAGLFLVMLALGAADAAKKVANDTTTINPTNVVVIDDDLMMAQAVSDAQVGATLAQETATGRGVIVAVLDGGFILSHVDVAPHLSSVAYDAVDGDNDPTDPGDGIDNDGDGVTDRAAGHGTFVAGMVISAAPDATIMPIRVVDDEGFGTADQLLDGAYFAVHNGATVINVSLEAAKVNPADLRSFFKVAERHGVVVVASTGNSGLSEPGAIALSANSLAVGAVDSEDRIAVFSNLPEQWEGYGVFAPGVDLYGPTGIPYDWSCGYWSGTSFSAGVVSGGVALVKQLHPDWAPEAVRKWVAQCVDPVFDRNGNVYPFAGRINLTDLVR